jgi:hypothetical protein
MIDMNEMMSMLSRSRPVFHSEADFQHAFAWEIQKQYLNCSIRLELKPPYLKERIYLDIWCVHEDAIIAIELKYKTRGLIVNVNEETFGLLDQSAQDVGRYDFIKDIQRLEQIVFDRSNIMGYAIFLTNDSAYWTLPRSNQTVDASFRIHDDRILTGELSWAPGASEGTMRGREDRLHVKGTYNLNWKDYSEISQKSYGRFRYLLVKVESGHKE